jgi:hypothetical protein
MLASTGIWGRRGGEARIAIGALFYLPLARWWSRRQAEAAELRADRRCTWARRPSP